MEKRKNNKNKHNILRLLSYIKRFYYLFVPALILVLIVSIATVVPIQIVKELSDLLSSKTTQNSNSNDVPLSITDEEANENIEQNNNKDINILENIENFISYKKFIGYFTDVSDDFNYFMALIIIGVIIGLIKFISYYFSSFFIDYMGRKMIFEVKKDLFNTIVHLPMEYFEKGRLGKVLAIINSDIIIIQDFAGQIMMTFVKELFTIMLIVLFMFIINPIMTLSLIIIGPVAVIVMNVIGKLIRKIEKRIREKFSDITNILVEVLNNILVVKSFAMEKKEKVNFIAENKKYLSQEKKFISIRCVNTPFLEFIGLLVILGIFAIGGYQILIGGMALGDLIIFATALALISAPIQNVSKGFIYVKQASASTERIFTLMDERKETLHETNKPDLPSIEGSIKLDNVSFSYGNKEEDVLKNINIEIEAKKTIALVGLSGGGKSTFVKLIPRLINPRSGKVFIDNHNILEYNLKSLREQISIVTQDILLFHGSIANNIRYGKQDATDEEVFEASKIANAYDFIMNNLPEKFNTQIGEKGIKLSGGQKQRIALARALVRKPRILILDEATSSLDTESENAIKEAFQKIQHQQTTIVIAHRLSTVINSDRIYVIDKGEIIEAGTHNELIKTSGIYKRLYELQFSVPEKDKE